MSPDIGKPGSSPIQQQILLEEDKYQKAFKADAKFGVLKEIRQKIKHLQAELGGKETRIEN